MCTGRWNVTGDIFGECSSETGVKQAGELSEISALTLTGVTVFLRIVRAL